MLHHLTIGGTAISENGFSMCPPINLVSGDTMGRPEVNTVDQAGILGFIERCNNFSQAKFCPIFTKIGTDDDQTNITQVIRPIFLNYQNRTPVTAYQNTEYRRALDKMT